MTLKEEDDLQQKFYDAIRGMTLPITLIGVPKKDYTIRHTGKFVIVIEDDNDQMLMVYKTAIVSIEAPATVAPLLMQQQKPAIRKLENFGNKLIDRSSPKPAIPVTIKKNKRAFS